MQRDEIERCSAELCEIMAKLHGEFPLMQLQKLHLTSFKIITIEKHTTVSHRR